ncbi:SET and WW domain protein [Aspergillus saccharolyticus JOP 1030-1]|uniref:Histone-lysine N-methyltransferase, H3 lysine-36 specific n=1 Tax=Aspergillus saccharolyticus JOP 1030-1 TaxID=1450539 RepID=A0A318Z1P8_9EURO|nr:SET and WW domain protein [Aspergillus saccharolyticus JOP 1030-1]PYH40314.1 SET and WW domain protein [Aspergillus saccharolyticus JOP 1030-1]
MSPHDNADRQSEPVANAVTAMKLDSDATLDTPTINGGGIMSKHESDADFDAVSLEASRDTHAPPKSRSASRAPLKKEQEGGFQYSRNSRDVKVEATEEIQPGDMEEKVGGDILVKLEPGQPPKLTRSSSQKVAARPPQLFSHLPDSTAQAEETFEVMEACTYANKYMGYTEHAMECDCAEEWEPSVSKNLACGEDSDCINRATKIECMGDCGCGPECQNQRFQQREYAPVAVIKTEKKGFGLRAEAELRPHQFIFEYVGEVINETQFRRRMRQYDEEGIKHFYFMSLSKGEFVDATKKGNLGRFCNHSCNPNCYVDKWVVGEKLRMGIFAERHIRAGEELVFNYNVDRYGADPQPCYCGEPNCTGFIGGRTQTERATKLSHATIEALGIEDSDGWDTAVAKRPRKKKMGEDDEEYVDSVQPKSLDENGVTKVMAALMQCKEKWIAVKLLGRIQRCEDERVSNRVVKMHGYQILNSQLGLWKEDFNVILQILDILDKFPRLTRNKILDSKIESTIQPLTSCGDERVEKKAAMLLQIWSTLEVGYRIPRMKRDPNATSQAFNQFERRETTRDERRRSKSRSRSRSKSIDAPRGPAAQRAGHVPRGPLHNGPRPFRRQFNPLPPGWFAAESNGRTYFYSARGEVTWTRPTVSAPQPAAPLKESRDKALQDIIDGIMNAKEHTPKEKSGTPATPQTSKATPDQKEGQEKWRSLSEEKRKKIYENTLFPHVKYVVDKFKHKLPKDDLKRYAKDVAKKLVNSDFKNNRVEDPTKIDERQQKKVKNFCKEFFDKAVAKHRAHEERKAERQSKEAQSKPGVLTAAGPAEEDLDVRMSDDEYEHHGLVQERCTNMSPTEEMQGTLKRKRQAETSAGDARNFATPSSSKRQRSSTPPPPPPPPISPEHDDAQDDQDEYKQSLSGDDANMKSESDELTLADRQTSNPPPPAPPPPPPLPEHGHHNEGEGTQLQSSQLGIEGRV